MDSVKFHILTFGCQMNIRDSQWLAAMLNKKGYRQAPLDEARIVILNTCSVRAKPEQKVKNAVRQITALAKDRPDMLIAVFGCVAQQLGEQLLSLSPLLRLVGGTDCVDAGPDAIERLLNNPQETLVLLDFKKDYQEREADPGDAKPSSYVSIMQGCDNFCSYCIVPFTRGRQKSRASKAIIEECSRRIAEGAKEIVLLGQNVNSWKEEGRDFAWLLKEVAKVPEIKRLRFLTSHPADLNDSLISAFGEIEYLCPSIHLPMQAGSNQILQAMRRRYTREKYLELVLKLRSVRKDIALATDIITGFPGETEADFLQTLEMMEACSFASSFSFCYSDRPGTLASTMKNKIPYETGLERLARVQSLQEKLTGTWLNSRIGKHAAVLIEGRNSRTGAWQGHDEYGDTVHFQPESAPEISQIVTAKIIAAKRHTLTGEIISG